MSESAAFCDVVQKSRRVKAAIEAGTPLVMVNVMPQQAKLIREREGGPHCKGLAFKHVGDLCQECNYVQLDARIKIKD